MRHTSLTVIFMRHSNIRKGSKLVGQRHNQLREQAKTQWRVHWWFQHHSREGGHTGRLQIQALLAQTDFVRPAVCYKRAEAATHLSSCRVQPFHHPCSHQPVASCISQSGASNSHWQHVEAVPKTTAATVGTPRDLRSSIGYQVCYWAGECCWRQLSVTDQNKSVVTSQPVNHGPCALAWHECMNMPTMPTQICTTHQTTKEEQRVLTNVIASYSDTSGPTQCCNWLYQNN